MQPSSRIYIAGHRGLVGSAIERRCRALGFDNLLLRTRAELDLRSQSAVERFFAANRPEYVFLAAALAGGIHAHNTHPVDYIRDNLLIATHVIDAAWRNGARKLLFLGSSCLYPRYALQPMREEYLFTGLLEPTSQWSAIAKLAGLKICQALRAQDGFDAISVLPASLYGPGDNFDLETSRVVPALVRKIDAAMTDGAAAVKVWGTGKPRREFLHVDDFADACLFLMEKYSGAAPVNVGWGDDISIEELASSIARIVGFQGRLEFDTARPDGPAQRLLDVSRLSALGWHADTDLETGLRSTWNWYREHLLNDEGAPRLRGAA